MEMEKKWGSEIEKGLRRFEKVTAKRVVKELGHERMM